MLRRRKGQETRGTDPMFMHRAVIPVEIDDDGQPLGAALGGGISEIPIALHPACASGAQLSGVHTQL